MDGKTLEIRQNEKDLDPFLNLPFSIYRGDPYWVPPVKKDVRDILGPGNPFWNHSKKIIFTAYRDGAAAGRIAGIIDDNHIEFHQEKAGFFGFFESINDYSVAEALLNSVKKWLRENGMEIMRGPVNPSTNEDCGFLLEGFGSAPFIMMTYNPAYYLDFMERYGLLKAKDLFAWLMPVENGPVMRLEKLSSRIRNKFPQLVVRPLEKKKFDEEIDAIMDIYNGAWEKNWGFVPMTEDEMRHLGKKLKPIVEPGLLQLAFFDKEPAGFLMALPDFNQALKLLHGKMTPLGILKLLYYAPKIRTARLLTLGVKEKFRKHGIDALLYHNSLKYALEKGYKWCEFSWILEDNVLTNRAAGTMGGKLYKKYRIYETKI